jgi:hypothetical protein
MSKNEGWVCPLCGKVNAPWVPQCGCDAKKYEPVYPDDFKEGKWHPMCPYPTYPVITCCLM